LPIAPSTYFDHQAKRADPGRRVARALTDAAGEALLLVPGVPLSVAGPAATVLPDLGATLDAIVDPALARFYGLHRPQRCRRA
jgi:hypothetical protein